MCELIQYTEKYQLELIEFLKTCLPQSGRVLDGRYKMYYNIKNYFNNFWCLLDNKIIIGTVGIKKISDNSCELKSLYIYQNYYHRGLGYKLLINTIVDAKKRKYLKMYLDTLSTSKEAISLYKKVGFVDTERYNENKIADIFMVLALDK